MEKVPHPNQFLGNLFLPFSLFLPIHAMLCYAMQEKSCGYAERKKKEKNYAMRKERKTTLMQTMESHVIHH